MILYCRHIIVVWLGATTYINLTLIHPPDKKIVPTFHRSLCIYIYIAFLSILTLNPVRIKLGLMEILGFAHTYHILFNSCSQRSPSGDIYRN